MIYVVTVSNTGNTTLTGMDLDDGLVDAFPNATVTNTSAFGSTAVLLPGETVSATFTVVVTAKGVPGPYDSLSTVSATGPQGSVLATAAAQVTLDVGYDLTVAVDAPTSGAPGGSHTQIITVSNNGPAAAFAPIVATLTLDPSASFQSYSGEGWDCSVDGSEVTCTFDDKIDAGAPSTVAIVTLIDADLGDVLDFSVSVDSEGTGSDTDPLNNVLALQLSVEELPVTGVSSDLVALVGALLLLIGCAVVIGTRWETDDDPQPAT